jgi:hypothetical protein
MTSETEDWKKLCHMVADEADPVKRTELVEQLIGALDARKEQLEDPAGTSSPMVITNPRIGSE